jgi:hypothetical protein
MGSKNLFRRTRMRLITRVDDSVRSEERAVNGHSLRPVMATITAGLVLGILAVSLLLAQTALAAGVVADEPCLKCVYEASVARNIGLAEFYAAKLETGRAADTARYGGLAAAYVAREETRLVAEAARYRGLAVRDAEKREASVRAYAARYGDLSADYAARKVASLAANDAWYRAMAADFVARKEASLGANEAWYSGMARAYGGERQDAPFGASAERYTSLAAYYATKNAGGQCC